MSRPFVHLHLHSQYSLLDGAIQFPALMSRTKDYGMSAVALTDHGNLFGAIDFYLEAQKYNIKPIIGCEMYVAPKSRYNKKADFGRREAVSHITLLACTNTGYKNLLKLTTLSYLDGFYYKPRIDKELLAEYSNGIIALSGCVQGDIFQALIANNREQAINLALQYRDIFGRDNFFIEVMDHGLEKQRACRSTLIEIAKLIGVGIVATNDVHFLDRNHYEAHDVMICIGKGALIHDENRIHYPAEVYFKNGDEMSNLFLDIPEAIENTLMIAYRCQVTLDFSDVKYPEYHPPDFKTSEQYLRELCELGLKKRYHFPCDNEKEILERFEYEFSIILKTGFISYFLIVWDFIHYAKENQIAVGPGRGSVAGSLIAYVLDITDLDPLKYGLLFERFLNPDRVSPPDIDIDFCQNRRSEVIEYVKKKYGERSVAQIITFGTMGAKSVVRDVGRVLGWNYSDADRIAKMIPNELNITLNGKIVTGKKEEGAIDKNPALKLAVASDQSVAQLWNYALFLEGLVRNTGVHAAGIVISDHDLSDDIPLARTNDNGIISQYSMVPLMELGLLKMDFLGLKTLTVIQDTIRFIKQSLPLFDISSISMNDHKTFDLLNRGQSIGVFQLESGGMIAIEKKFNIQNFTDIIALIALYRPGPMQFIDEYIERKKGRKKIEYAHPLLEKICSETYGIIIYQEQVQQAASVLAGYTLGQADLLRRAMGKKDIEKMAKERTIFVKGCERFNNITSQQANAIFDFLEKFAQYGFNKSHSAAYGLISYQTAYLKANFPIEFMASLLTHEIHNTEKITILINECKNMNISILPPNVNKSMLTFFPEETENGKQIRFGLSAIKNIGNILSVIQEREKNGDYRSLEDFCMRTDTGVLNKKNLESFIRSGAFDWDGRNRSTLEQHIEKALQLGTTSQHDRSIGQVSLFSTEKQIFSDYNSSLPVKENWSLSKQLGYEKELLGFYVTGHPLDEYSCIMKKYQPISKIINHHSKNKVQIIGLLAKIEKRFTKNGSKPFTILTLEDKSNSIDLIAWDDMLEKYADILQIGHVLICTVQHKNQGNVTRVNLIEISEALPDNHSKDSVFIEILYQHLSNLEFMINIFKKYPGNKIVILKILLNSGEIIQMKLGKLFKIGDEKLVKEELTKVLHQEIIHLN